MVQEDEISAQLQLQKQQIYFDTNVCHGLTNVDGSKAAVTLGSIIRLFFFFLCCCLSCQGQTPADAIVQFDFFGNK